MPEKRATFFMFSNAKMYGISSLRRVFGNNVATVGRIWVHLLLLPEARFKDSFVHVIFAIAGRKTFTAFQSAFNAWGQPWANGLGWSLNRSSDMPGLASKFKPPRPLGQAGR